ncbi:MAG: SusC/RagA family TonB-linked outer membrane protein [Bacteroidota bacterium]
MKRLLLLVAFMLPVALLFAQRTVTGKVTDEKGAPLSGVSVSAKGTRVGTSTNINGDFSLNVPANARTLVFTSIGFQSREASISGSNTTVNIRLEVSATESENIILTGYTRERASKYSGSASKVSSERINNIPNASLDQILQGRAPGLYSVAGSGQPGAAATVLIRGAGSISGVTAPLYIMDGIPIEAGVFQSLNPSDIESVDVLKDASSTALYGSRGANGVIVITSKRGKAGKTVFSIKSQYGYANRTTPKFEMMNTQERLQFEKEVGQEFGVTIGPGWYLSKDNPANAGLSTAQQTEMDRRLDSLNHNNTDWVDLFFRTGKFQEHELSASGGNDKVRFYTSFNYYNQEGIAYRSDLERYTFRGNLDFSSSRFTASISTGIGFTKRNFIESENTTAITNPFSSAYYALPYEQPYVDGVLVASGMASGPRLAAATYNPLLPSNTGAPTVPILPSRVLVYDQREGSDALERLASTTSANNQLKGTISGNFRLKLTNELSAQGTIGLDFRETVGDRLIKPGTHTGTLVTGLRGSFSENFARNIQIAANGGLVYAKTIGQDHSFEVMGLFEVLRDWGHNFTYVGFGIDPLRQGTPSGITAGSTAGFIPTVAGGRAVPNRAYAAFIGAGKYSFKDKYTLNLSYRYDGATQVPEERRWKGFYAAGATWNVMKEKFMTNVNFLNSLLLRASHGQTAAQFVNDFAYLANYAGGAGARYDGIQGLAPTFGNTALQWEYTTTTNIGTDLSFWQRRVRMKVDVYNKKTINVVINQNLSFTSGFAAGQINAGTMVNKGIESEFSVDIVRSKDVLVAVGANFGYNKNRITSLGSVNEFIQGTGIIRVGLPLGSHYIVKWAGVDPLTGNPQYYNRDGSITTTYDRANQSVAEFGTSIPPFTGGFNASLRFKGFYVEAFFSFASGFKRFNNEDFFNENITFATSNQSRRVFTDRWKKPGDVTDIQRYNSSRQFSSKDVQDASFIRFRNLNVGYVVPASVLSRLKVISGATLYIQGQNIATFTKWRQFDPEDGNNIAAFEYPANRMITFGIKLDF